MPLPQWSEWEREVAESFGGKVTPGSGSKWFSKGDVRSENYIISCKQTNRNSFNLTRMDLREIENIAAADDKEWALAININGRKVVVLPWDQFAYKRA